MEQSQIALSFLWTSLMLIYLLGDVLRIFAGDFKPGFIEGKKVPSIAYFGIAIIMVVPILMVVLNVFFKGNIANTANVIVSALFILFNLSGFLGYKLYDKFLLVVSFLINLLVIWQVTLIG